MKLITRDLLDQLVLKARASPRGRAHHNIHPSAADPVQRFVVAVERRSYFRPHRHRTRAELAWVLLGGFDVITFDDAGCIQSRCSVGEGTERLAFETPPDVWHTLLARHDGSAFLEVKEGPYDPATSAEFAPWAPAEGTAEVASFQQLLQQATVGSRLLP